MPAIMTDHIAKSRTRCVVSHLSVIIHAEAPLMEPYMSRAIGIIQPQHNAIATASAVPSNSRSRNRSDSTDVRETSSGFVSADDAVGAPVDVREVGMGAVKVQFDRPLGPAL